MSRRKEFGVGLVIIVSVAVAVLGTLWMQGAGFGRARTAIEVLVEGVGQLQDGNAVAYRGVRIGQVASITVEPGGDAVRLVLLLSEEVVLPGDAAVILAPESMFGAWQADIVSRAAYPGYPFYQVAASRSTAGIPLLGGYALPELSRLTASAEQISLNLAELTERMELAFNEETAANLTQAIGNIEGITREVRTLVAQQSEVAASITANADSALAEIQTAAATARESFDRVQAILEDRQIDSMVTNLAVASGGMRRLSEQLTDSTGSFATALVRADSSLARIERITQRVESSEGSVGRLLADSTAAMRAEEVLTQLDLLLRDFRENPGKYVRLSIF